jgi:hypothetical protein
VEVYAVHGHYTEMLKVRGVETRDGVAECSERVMNAAEADALVLQGLLAGRAESRHIARSSVERRGVLGEHVGGE